MSAANKIGVYPGRNYDMPVFLFTNCDMGSHSHDSVWIKCVAHGFQVRHGFWFPNMAESLELGARPRWHL